MIELIDRDIKAATVNKYATYIQEDRTKHVKERHGRHKKSNIKFLGMKM